MDHLGPNYPPPLICSDLFISLGYLCFMFSSMYREGDQSIRGGMPPFSVHWSHSYEADYSSDGLCGFSLDGMEKSVWFCYDGFPWLPIAMYRVYVLDVPAAVHDGFDERT